MQNNQNGGWRILDLMVYSIYHECFPTFGDAKVPGLGCRIIRCQVADKVSIPKAVERVKNFLLTNFDSLRPANNIGVRVIPIDQSGEWVSSSVSSEWIRVTQRRCTLGSKTKKKRQNP